MAKYFVAIAFVAIAACTTVGSNKGYVVCHDTRANVTCPSNTANVVVSNS